MRVSKKRSYAEDVRQCNLALRLIAFEVRTHTIRRMTGLTDDRIRNLSRLAKRDTKGVRIVRHRGSAPHSVDFFLANAQIRNETAALLSLCCLTKVLPERHGNGVAPPSLDISRGEQLCDAFEIFKTLSPETRITLEHLLFLLWATTQNDQLVASHCLECTSLIVVDPLSLVRHVCDHCRGQAAEPVTAEQPRSYLKAAEASAPEYGDHRL